ncbi:hypothetical protein CALVIDRAFT_488640 [Calocera viscosa TUFC12733]|uniref:Tc1-like transposase DDE domain-containing protein n=1 Tax=Calocera viscosa (strain TUFC12733) TaxID=1330018 RepID=A0A167HJY8_CALVF|nr:hypothetical protein CALVIDRAFT_488640 [Calocera viscosa TUFC12733]
MDWPGYSADLNIIEHCWTYLKRKLRQNHPFASTPDKIWDAAQKEWAEIPLSFIRTLYGSMERRVEAVHNAKGWQTPY